MARSTTPPPHTHTHINLNRWVLLQSDTALPARWHSLRCAPRRVCVARDHGRRRPPHTHTRTHTHTHTRTHKHTHTNTHTHTHTQLRQLRSGADCRATPHRCGVVHVANARLQWRTGALSRAHTTPAWPACRVRSGVWSKCAAALHSHVQSTTGWHGRVV